MAVSHEHLTGTVQTWNGKAYAMMDVKEARKLQRENLIQITTNLTAADLKRPEDFGTVEAKPKRRNQRQYKTREMKADT